MFPENKDPANTYIDPDISGLLINDVWLRAAGNGLPTLPPQSRVFCDGDEERWWQENELQSPLTAVQQNRPAAGTTRVHPEKSDLLRTRTQRLLSGTEEPTKTSS